MTATSHLSRKPNARGTTIAWLAKRDAMTAKLAAETRAARRPFIVRVINSVADALRMGRRV